MSSKIIVILGPTAVGKSTLGVALAKKFNGEIISADSRQIYEGLTIGTGAATEKEMENVPHYLIGIIDPRNEFSVAHFKDLAENSIFETHRNGKLPIVVGGTGFYIQSVVDNIVPPHVPPNEKLREELQKKSSEELLEKLKATDPERAVTVEPKNKRRIIRALEIAAHIGKVPSVQHNNPKYDVLQIGLQLPVKKLTERIQKRVKERLQNGWVEEVKKLLDSGVPKERLKEFGLGYALIAEGADNLVNKITTAERQYAKRQMRWFKRDKRIHWFDPKEEKEITSLVQNFLHDDESNVS